MSARTLRMRAVRGAFRPRAVQWEPFVVEKTGSTNRLWRGSGPSGEWLLKWYRYPGEGVHPESEISQFLQEQNFRGVAEFGARLDAHGPGGWRTVAFVQRWLEGCSVWEKAVVAMRTGAREKVFARELGRAVGRLHGALGSGASGTAFCAEPWGVAAHTAWMGRISESIKRFKGACCGGCPPGLDGASWREAKQLGESGMKHAERRLRELAGVKVGGEVIRIHGDLHLGQILAVATSEGGAEFVMLDFEGEPVRSIAERRAKDSPLRDVAGMFRSFAYAAAVAGAPLETSELWSAEFLEGWKEHMALPEGDWRGFLAGLVWEKAVYEAEYEMRHRPDWLWIPLRVLSEGDSV